MEETHIPVPKLYLHDKFFARYLDRFVPRWLKPNHVTVVRFIMVPFVLYFLGMGEYAIGILLFFLAGLTDMLDGSLARVRKQITEWGIAYDPIADKLLVGSTLALLILTQVQSTIAVVLLGIEGVLLLTNVAVRQFHIVRMATFSGKLKMVLEVIGIVLLLFATAFENTTLTRVSIFILGAAIVAAVFSIMSGLLYVGKRSKEQTQQQPPA